MISWGRAATRLSVAGVVFTLIGCATQNVFHSLRGAGYPGYAIEYVDAVPSPGTPVAQGSNVEFKITVRYVLQNRDSGVLQLLFRNERDLDVLPPGVALPIKRERWQRATLTQRVEIPRDGRDFLVTVAVVPEGATSSSGMLQMRYPVSLQK